MKYCSNCGSKLEEGQDVCLGCGRVITSVGKVSMEKPQYRGYSIATGIVMIVLGFIMLCGYVTLDYYDGVLIFLFPGMLGLLAGTLSIVSIKNKTLLLSSGIMLLGGALINIVGIEDISIYAICAIVFGILNIIFSIKR